MEFMRKFALGAPDPANTSLWIVRVPFNSSDVFIAAETFTATTTKIPAEARFSGGRNNYYPGTADIDALSVSFYETHDYQVTKWLKKWRDLVELDGIYGLPAVFKKTIYLFAYSKFNTKPERTFTYKRVWPTDRGPYEYNQDAEGRVILQAQFSVDRVEEQ